MSLIEKTNMDLVLDYGTDLIDFYIKHPCTAAYELLGVDLAPIQRIIFKDMWFKNYSITVMGRGGGKTYLLAVLSLLSCMLYPGYRVGLIAPVFRQSLVISDSYDTFWTTFGLKTTSEEFYKSIQPGITQTQSLYSQNTILSKWKNNERACRSIKTTKGFELSGTVDHAIIVLDNNIDIVYKDLQDIKNEYIAIKIGFNYFGNDNSMPKFDEFEYNWKTKDCIIPSELTPDLSYWMGLLVGDGCVSIGKDKRKQRVDFVNEDQDLLDSFENYLRKYFLVDKYEEINRDNRKNNTWEIQYYCKKLVNYLLKCGFTKTTALDKKIPDVIKKASKEIFIAFLQGLFDTDGGVYIQKNKGCEITFSTSSLQLAKELQSVLLNLGIVSNLGISKKAEVRQLKCGNKPSKCAEAYKIRITGQEFITKFSNIIGFRCERKNEKLTNYLNEHFNKKESLARVLGLPRTIINNNYSKCKSYLDQGLYFVKMIDSDYFLAPTIDAEVENEHCYWANGFINHNSKMIFAEVEKLYARSILLREACEKKPTRNPDTCYLKFKSIGGFSGSYIEALPLGDGCLTAYNYLTFYDRFGTIADAHDVDVEQNHYIDRNDIVWGNGEFRDSDRSLCNGIKDTIKIKTSKGFSSEGTPNHMFKVVRSGNIVWSRFDEMVVGDYILIDRSRRWHSGCSEVTKEQAYALGFLIADGCWTDARKTLSFAALDKEIVGLISNGLNCGFIQSADGCHYIANDDNPTILQKDVRNKWLSFWNMPVSYAIDKKLPDKILESTRNVMSSCIRGLFDGDGWVNEVGSVWFCNTSEELIDQLHYILLHYGIVACKIERSRNDKWNTCYELCISGKNAKIFYDEIGFSLKRKNNKLLNKLLGKKAITSGKDYVPFAKEVMLDIIDNNIFKSNKNSNEKRFRNLSRSKLNRNKYVTRHQIDLFLKKCEFHNVNDPAISKIKILANPDIYYDEIVSIGEGSCVTYDVQIPDGNEYCANGFFSHNSKIRGSRFYLVVIDELAQVPDKIIDMVVRPMAATTLEPMENVRRLEREKRLIEQGLATKDDFEEETVNKMIMTSSGYYKFNHMWRRMRDYWEQMGKFGDEKSQYVVYQVPHWDLPEGFLDKNNIKEAQRVMSNAEFRMEYEAAMISDSEGFFKASLLESCTLDSGFSIEAKGKSGEQYIVGVDPNQGGSASCGICIVKLVHINILVNVLEIKKNTTQDLTKTVQDICDTYNVMRIFMDKGGGGKSVCDLLEDGYDGYDPIIDITNKDHEHMKGRHILEMVNFNPGWISDANFTTLSLLENRTLRFPEPPTSTLDLDARVYESIKKLKSQMLNIIVTQTSSGLLHFDTPKRGQNKDLYSAFILAGHGVREFEKYMEPDSRPELFSSGLIREHRPGARFAPMGGKAVVNSNRGNSNPLSAALLTPRKK